jgi:hypothetical protein
VLVARWNSPPSPTKGYRNVQAALHDLFSFLVFAGLPAACLTLARRFAGWGERGWAILSAVTGVALVVGFLLASLAFNQVEGLEPVGGPGRVAAHRVGDEHPSPDQPDGIGPDQQRPPSSRRGAAGPATARPRRPGSARR